jgi:hypothetical protein
MTEFTTTELNMTELNMTELNTTELNKQDHIISDLAEKYKDNPYILQRLQIHVINLPAILETENKRYLERVLRINELTLEQDNFYKVFLSKHQYFYMPYNNIFYEYDGKTYRIVKEDDIHHHLLSTITDEGKLIAWKHKTKQNILKQIKDRTLFKSVPETYTIQNVLGFLNTIFETKTEIKYFLTVIGDCILRKNTEETGLLFFINSSMKKLVSFIDSICCITTGNSIMSNFISKYHDTHNLLGYRLIRTNENFNSITTDLIKDVLNKIGIDLISVAAHYSERYVSSDQFLINLPNKDPAREYAMFFTLNTPNKIVEQFVSQCIEPVSKTNTNIFSTTCSLSWKNMHYIWKLYLSSINVPNMMYSNNLKVLLKSHLSYSVINSSSVFDMGLGFPNVTSKFLPIVSSFLSFWDKHITIINSNDSNILDEEYEIDEISSIYKLTNKTFSYSHISDKEIIKMIWHFFNPSVDIIENKYITNIHCNLWSKHDDIGEMLDYYKQQHKNELIHDSLISFDELYQNYKSYIQAKVTVENSFHPNVSKHFFEKYLSHYLKAHIKFEKFVSSDWIQS